MSKKKIPKRMKLLKYHWFEVLVHNMLKLIGIKNTIFNCNEDFEAYKQWNKETKP